MTNYGEWVNTNEGQLKAFLKEFNDWVFSNNPYPSQKPGKLFLQGKIGDPGVRQESHDINRGEPIIVHVVGTNFIKGDNDRRGNRIDDDNQIKAACQDEEGDDGVDFVKIKRQGDTDWTHLDEFVKIVRSSPDDFGANNSDLGKWKPPMTAGRLRGAWSSRLLALKVPEEAETGVYELSFEGHGSNNYRQRGNFNITIR